MTYQERLRVPGSWWVIGLFFAVTFVTAVGLYGGPEVALTAGALGTISVAAALLWYGRFRIVVDQDGLRVGEATLEWEYLGRVQVLTGAATRQRLGPGADPAAWLLVRGYLPKAVEIEVLDPADPHPYWLISSRAPQQLAAAIDSARPTRLS